MARPARKRESYPDDGARLASGANENHRRPPEALVSVNIAKAWGKSRLCKQRTESENERLPMQGIEKTAAQYCVRVGQRVELPGHKFSIARKSFRMLWKMVGTTGLEPATSSVSRKRSNQLSYAPAVQLPKFSRNRPIRETRLLPLVRNAVPSLTSD